MTLMQVAEQGSNRKFVANHVNSVKYSFIFHHDVVMTNTMTAITSPWSSTRFRCSGALCWGCVSGAELGGVGWGWGSVFDRGWVSVTVGVWVWDYRGHGGGGGADGNKGGV